MEHESFENEEIARVMNEHFVSIKVDREERPDLDQIYMNAVQMLTRQRRLADVRVPHARPEAVFRRHLLPAARIATACRAFAASCSAIADAWKTSREQSRRSRPARRGAACKRLRSCTDAVEGDCSTETLLENAAATA